MPSQKLVSQKSCCMSYEVLFITKGGVTLDTPFVTLRLPSWLFNFFTNNSLHYIVTIHIPLMTLGISLTTYLQIMYIFHMCPCETKQARDSLKRHNTMTLKFQAKPTRQLPLDNSWSRTDAKLDTMLWCPQTAWWCFLIANSCLHSFWVYGLGTCVHLALKHVQHGVDHEWTTSVFLHAWCAQHQVIPSDLSP